LFNILSKFDISVKVMRLEICLYGAHSEVWLGKHLSYKLSTKNGLKHGDAFMKLHFFNQYQVLLDHNESAQFRNDRQLCIFIQGCIKKFLDFLPQTANRWYSVNTCAMIERWQRRHAVCQVASLCEHRELHNTSVSHPLVSSHLRFQHGPETGAASQYQILRQTRQIWSGDF
jgi:hypothetical protein